MHTGHAGGGGEVVWNPTHRAQGGGQLPTGYRACRGRWFGRRHLACLALAQGVGQPPHRAHRGEVESGLKCYCFDCCLCCCFFLLLLVFCCCMSCYCCMSCCSCLHFLLHTEGKSMFALGTPVKSKFNEKDILYVVCSKISTELKKK